MAEGVRFELTGRRSAQRFSGPPQSTRLCHPSDLRNSWRMREGSNLRETLRPGYRLASGPLPTRARILTLNERRFRPAGGAWSLCTCRAVRKWWVMEDSNLSPKGTDLQSADGSPVRLVTTRTRHDLEPLNVGQGGRLRPCDPRGPSSVRYQTALRPDGRPEGPHSFMRTGVAAGARSDLHDVKQRWFEFDRARGPDPETKKARPPIVSDGGLAFTFRCPGLQILQGSFVPGVPRLRPVVSLPE